MASVIEYGSEQFDAIKPTKPTMLFCTSAQAKEEHYLKRVAAWVTQAKKFGFECDFYCFHDGQLNRELLNDELNEVTFITFDKPLGRLSVWEIPGWKRSLAAAMKLSERYGYCVHIESDALICRRDKFNKLAKIDKLVALPFCARYGMPETAVMILNDRNLRKEIYEFYSQPESLYTNVNFEGSELYKLISPHVTYFGLSCRFEGKSDSFRYEVCTQISPEIIRRSDEFQFNPTYPESFQHAIAALR